MKPVLIDLDGVLRLGSAPAEGLREFISFVCRSRRPACIISNSTLLTRKDLRQFFRDNDLECRLPMMTAADAALSYVQQKYQKAAVYCSGHIKKSFSRYLDYDNPEVVVMGDMGNEWNYGILNDIFLKVRGGAELVAMQKNRFWNTPEEGFLLDLGPFVAAIEYACEVEATLIGKPSPLYFHSALDLIGSDITDGFIMIGDDMETDIKGSQNLDAETILVFTGKTQKPLKKKMAVKPDYTADNLFDVMEIIKRI